MLKFRPLGLPDEVPLVSVSFIICGRPLPPPSHLRHLTPGPPAVTGGRFPEDASLSAFPAVLLSSDPSLPISGAPREGENDSVCKPFPQMPLPLRLLCSSRPQCFRHFLAFTSLYLFICSPDWVARASKTRSVLLFICCSLSIWHRIDSTSSPVVA